MENHGMRMDTQQSSSTPADMSQSSSKPRIMTVKRLFLCINCLLLAFGIVGGPLVMRLYFLHGGQLTWLQSFLETGGFPVMILPIAYMSYQRRKQNPSSPLLRITPTLALCAIGLGIFTGASDFLYSRGVKLIPVSTSSLVLSTHLVFTAIFCRFLINQKFTPFSINAIFLLTIGAVILGISGRGDNNESKSKSDFIVGFFMVMGSGAIFALVIPLVEKTYRISKIAVDYALVTEMQFFLSLSATVFCTVGMIIHGDFKIIPKEAKASDLGEPMYYLILIASAVAWQSFYLGVLGVVHFGTAMLTAIVTATCLPISELLAVVFYKEDFRPEKAISLVLSLWGFSSYFYGQYQKMKSSTNDDEAKSVSDDPKSSDQIRLQMETA